MYKNINYICLILYVGYRIVKSARREFKDDIVDFSNFIDKESEAQRY